MQTTTKCTLGWIGLTLSGFASAQAPLGGSGTIVFTGPPMPVPTLGLLAAVLLAGLFLVVALGLLQKHRHSLASFALVGAAIGSAFTVASVGISRAVSATEVDVALSDLGQPLSFSCASRGFTVTDFTNNTNLTIDVASIDAGDCTVGTAGESLNCTASETALAPGESCSVLAQAKPQE